MEKIVLRTFLVGSWVDTKISNDINSKETLFELLCLILNDKLFVKNMFGFVLQKI